MSLQINKRITTVNVRIINTNFFVMTVYKPNEDVIITEKENFYTYLEATVERVKPEQKLSLLEDLNERFKSSETR